MLVHCFAGKSRATSFTLAYLVGKKGIPLKEGLETIRAVRPIVQPNIGFFTQLKIFEKKVLGFESDIDKFKPDIMARIKETAEKRAELKK